MQNNAAGDAPENSLQGFFADFHKGPPFSYLISAILQKKSAFVKPFPKRNRPALRQGRPGMQKHPLAEFLRYCYQIPPIQSIDSDFGRFDP